MVVLKPDRTGPFPFPKSDPEARKKDFSEVEQPYTKEQAMTEADRCLRCGTPVCIDACPVQMDVRGMMDAAEYAKFCDVIGLDFYPNYKASELVDASVIERTGAAAAESGKPVFIAETGYPSGPALLGYSEGRQSEYVAQALREAYSQDKVTGIGIWRYLDTSWSSFPPQENHFGLIDEKTGPKAAWYRYAQVRKDLLG